MRRTSALFSAVALSAAVGFGSAGAAHAQYPPLTGAATVSATTVAVGENVTFSGTGCAAGAEVTINVGSATVTTTTADDAGAYSASVPLTTAGAHVLTGTCLTDAGAPLVLSATVTAVVDAADDVLPSTGSTSTIPSLLVGLLGVAAGSVLVFVGRRRSRTARATA